MLVECPLGDVVDKVTILRIKATRLRDPGALAAVHEELRTLEAAWSAADLPPMEALARYTELADVNLALWEVEDALRDHERRQDFGGAFVAAARSVYRLNDRRAALKRAINEALGSRLVEHKSYGSGP